jgi:Clp amino terminal domain, pathogenicity island component
VERNLAALVEQMAGSGAGERLVAVAALRRRLDALEADYVDAALRSGWSWSQIGAALGVSRQAAHKKHSRRGAGREPYEGAGREPYEGAGRAEVLVSDEARRAVRIARLEARTLGEDTVGTEHLLLGLIRSDTGPAGRVLRGLGVSLSRARGAVEPGHEEATARERAADDPAPSEPPISPLARSVLEKALRDSLQSEDAPLTGERLLLALLQADAGGAVRALQRLGVPPSSVRRELERVA